MTPVVKNLPANAGDTGDAGLIPESGRSPGERNGNPLQYSCLENPMDHGAWWATVHGAAKSRTLLSDFTSLASYVMLSTLHDLSHFNLFNSIRK